VCSASTALHCAISTHLDETNVSTQPSRQRLPLNTRYIDYVVRRPICSTRISSAWTCKRAAPRIQAPCESSSSSSSSSSWRHVTSRVTYAHDVYHLTMFCSSQQDAATICPAPCKFTFDLLTAADWHNGLRRQEVPRTKRATRLEVRQSH